MSSGSSSKRLQYTQEQQVVRAASPRNGTERNIEIQYADAKVIGNGSFGVVYLAKLVTTGEDIAIKKVLQDKRFKNRELQIMRRLNHRNVVKLLYFFYSNGDKKDEVYLNLILEYVPETVYKVARHYSKQRQIIPVLYIKIYMYQLFRALAYIHSTGICHRDIKPQNLLLNAQTSVLKLCDFGSAKVLVHGEPNVAYICSRYYRAPELIFGATNYTTRIDVWSAGTVLAELLIGQPFFPGDSGVDQLVEIIKVLGTPSREEIQQMNPNYTEFRFPMIRPHPWTRVFRARTPQDAVDLVSKLLRYTPTERLTPYEAMAHEFFDELRSPACKLPSNNPMPPLFDWTEYELSIIEPGILEKLQPRGGGGVGADIVESVHGGEEATGANSGGIGSSAGCIQQQQSGQGGGGNGGVRDYAQQSHQQIVDASASGGNTEGNSRSTPARRKHSDHQQQQPQGSSSGGAGGSGATAAAPTATAAL